MQQAPELAAVIRRGSIQLGENVGSVSDSRSGHLIVIVDGQFAVCNPLHPERGTTVLLQLPIAPDTVYGDLTLLSGSAV
uniref:Uncharacterized protein n=1 Tax=Arundo donax TaxID=35708 RepID=A0A0A9GA58_ARUDO